MENRYTDAKSLQPLAAHQDEETAELDGYVGLGMKKEALGLAREYLKAKRPVSQRVNSSVDTLMTMEDHLKQWRPLVEAAFGRLSKRGKRKVRTMMLSFYYGLKDFEAADRFVPKRFEGPLWFLDMMFGLDTKVALGKLQEASRIAMRAADVLEVMGNGFGRNLVLSSVANYFLETQQWDNAIGLWGELQQDECVAETATLGLVEVHLKRSLLAIRTGVEALNQLDQHPDPETEVIIPGNDAARWRKAKAKLAGTERLILGALRACGGDDDIDSKIRLVE